MRVIGLDIHRTFAQVAVLEHGTVKDQGRFAMEQETVLRFGKTLHADDEVVIEATVNTAVVARLSLRRSSSAWSWPTQCRCA